MKDPHLGKMRCCVRLFFHAVACPCEEPLLIRRAVSVLLFFKAFLLLMPVLSACRPTGLPTGLPTTARWCQPRSLRACSGITTATVGRIHRLIHLLIARKVSVMQVAEFDNVLRHILLEFFFIVRSSFQGKKLVEFPSFVCGPTRFDANAVVGHQHA